MQTTYNFECNPIVAWLVVNQSCNMRCKWCYAENEQYSSAQLSYELAKELIDISIEAGVNEFVLIGGEPTLWPELFRTIRYIHTQAKRVSVITNALRFCNDDFWKQYQETPADSLGISVKSVTPKQFTFVTGNHNLDKSLLGIERAISYHHGGVSAVHNTLVGTSGLLDIARTCKEFGATSFQMVMCTPTFDSDGEAKLGYAFHPKDTEDEILAVADQLEALYGNNVYFDLQLPLCLFSQDFVERMLSQHRLQTQCHVFTRSGINFDLLGNITICNEITETVLQRGIDFTDGKTLLTALNRPGVRSDYADLARYPSAECSHCKRKDDCRGGCIINWLLYEPEDICHAIV